MLQAPKRNGSKATVGRKLPISDAGQSALHCAAQNGHVDVVSVLLSTENVDVTLADSCGRSALHCAAHNGHADVVQCLLKDKRFGSRMVNKVDSSGDSALLLAICGKCASLIHMDDRDVLVIVPARPPHASTADAHDVSSERLIVHIAAACCCSATGRISRGCVGDSICMRVSSLCVSAGCLRRGVVHSCHIGITYRHTEVVDVLLQNRHVDHLRPNSRQVTVTNHTGEKQRWPAGLTPLHLAAVMGHADIVSAFARHGRISAESFVVFPGSPLDAAVVGNNPQCVRIVKEFVPMNRRGFEGNTCLHMAAQCSSVEIIECLLDLGVRVSAPRIPTNAPRACHSPHTHLHTATCGYALPP